VGAIMEAKGRRRVVIIGGGFGGLACAQKLAGAEVDVTLVDKRNHHLFQPLLYQVSTAALSPADIAIPIRRVLARARNVRVLLAEVTGVDSAARRVSLADGDSLPYDQLVLATGSAYTYFGNPQWAPLAPAPKSIEDARIIRARLLGAFEQAERTEDPARRAALMTFVVVGGGPTGVEMAGTTAELARHTLKGNFRAIDPAAARVILVEAGPRLLSSFPPDLGAYAVRALERLSVEVRLDCPVETLDEEGVVIGDERLEGATVVWGAGIRAADGADWLGGTDDKAGRIRVTPNLSVPGHNGVYALGDVALLEQDGAPLPGLAQVAQQQGKHLGRELRTRPVARPFRYRSRGDTAVIGRHAAVYTYGRYRMKGHLAWLLWAIVHVFLLVGFEQRIAVMLQWIWRYLTFERGARLID
jgi:NADH dehydrogenase